MFRKMFKVCCNPDPNTYTYSDGYNITGNSDTFWRLFNNFEDTASMWVKDVLSSEKLNGTPGQLSVSDRFLLKTNCMHTDQDGRRFTDTYTKDNSPAYAQNVGSYYCQPVDILNKHNITNIANAYRNSTMKIDFVINNYIGLFCDENKISLYINRIWCAFYFAG
ncbi:hypothetical protein EhV052 [Emiliania huxleyi virus 86]|uniref:Uncharacterized protein n=1 Tax=Emiliania huxleyi virus 86 (isolate United Kingdom/English Channel/1999) TaxID=654925 RepID=Q4A381_EHV8U|nr:hypothetical protein EhV052 [Emiliania huxleyi virus 86]AEO97864.1 hypothetical protein ENVG_00168 [Emiliania huxleyi virus 84]AEP14990.1 hypothetical protein EOVG_00053 [Emiliania huxleyi virus 88]AHA54617.1 hypothetical protein EhV145_00066 [Emiliania huxleyi virus 145]AHA55654.1 hypothetical protein EhV164_00064 [Emiliania huxleyi virus 164]CAI65475.1 hypothetical protein EhV052 [Emiliania huxleyi virus 86]